MAPLLGCDEARDPTPVRTPRLWTLSDLRAAYAAGETIASTPSFPAGLSPAELFEEPNPGVLVPHVAPAYSEGDAAAYVITDVWVNFDKVWAQPWYYLVTAWNDKPTSQNRLKEADGMTATPPLIDVGPNSAFYSPFWQIRYAEVPSDTPPDKYKNTRDLLAAKPALHLGSNWTYAVRPFDVTLGSGKVTHPYLPSKEVGLLVLGTVWWDDNLLGFLNIGGNNFRLDDELVVEEVPLFRFARVNAEGELQATELPAVVGSGPLGARRPAEVTADLRPKFGAFTRLYLAILPATAVPFDPDVNKAGAAALSKSGVDPNTYRNRVALNGKGATATAPSCFDAMTFPMSCQWLDSQSRVEEALGPNNLIRTEVTLTSPMVFYAGKGIGK